MRYLYDQLFIKEPGVTTRTPWHQDGGYWRVRGPKICSVFVPFDPVEKDESLAFVVGSQQWLLHNPQHFADGTPYTGTSLPPMPDIDEMVLQGKAQLQSFNLVPGDVLVFSSRTTHGIVLFLPASAAVCVWPSACPYVHGIDRQRSSYHIKYLRGICPAVNRFPLPSNAPFSLRRPGKLGPCALNKMVRRRHDLLVAPWGGRCSDRRHRPR